MPSASSIRLVASTGTQYNYNDPQDEVASFSGSESGTDSTSSGREPRHPDHGVFRSLHWTADGTTLITSSADNAIRSFILPPGLLEPPTTDEQPVAESNSHLLTSYTTQAHPTPPYASAVSPYYDLSYPETTLILSAPSSLPIRLFSPFAAGLLVTYPYYNESNERWITPHSLLFTMRGHEPEGGMVPSSSLHFLAGSKNHIALFDVNRDGSPPLANIPTAPGNRKKRRGGGNGMAGIVSAMAMSCEGVLAAGTFDRGLGLYDAYGMGNTIGTLSLRGSGRGSGMTSLHWSRCGRYLVSAERDCDVLGVWDIRNTGQRLAWLNGRNAGTKQRLGVSLGKTWSGMDYGEEVYAGDIDGQVHVWSGLGMKEGGLQEDWSWHAHDDAVSGVDVHYSGNVVATCSGSWLADPDSTWSGEDEDSYVPVQKITQADNSVRVWSLEEAMPAE